MAAAGIGIVGSLLSGWLGSRAASKAAKQQEKKATEAIGRWDQATPLIHQKALEEEQAGLGELEREREIGSGLYDPWREGGQESLTQLRSMLAPGGEFNKPLELGMQDITIDPSYQFRLQQGEQALARSAAAKGGVLSGGAAKSLARYSQGLASEEYGAAWQRKMAENEARMAENEARYGRLAGMSETGLGAAGQTAALRMGTAENIANLRGKYSSTYADTETNRLAAISNLLTGQGNVQAAGTMGGAQAWGTAIGGAANQASSYLNLQELLKAQKAARQGPYTI